MTSSREIEYRDLEIELGRCCCGKPEIRVLRSTFDRPRARFVLDDDTRASLEAKVAEFDEVLFPPDSASRRRELAEAIGVTLYELRFAGEVRRTFERSYDALRDEERLSLRLSFGATYDHFLGGLPWELLCDPETRRFLVSDGRISLARYLDLSERIRPMEAEPPLKILAVLASPCPETSEGHCYGEIDLGRQKELLKEIDGKASFLEIRFLDEEAEPGDGTLSALRRELVQAKQAGSPYSAVHFLCHGGFDSDKEGALFLEWSDGAEHLVTGRELAKQVTEDVRFVVLNSCATGKIPVPRHGGEHPFAGVASALVAAGMPAVVAMQFSVSEGAAAAFSKAFYESIDMSQSIDEAHEEGRLAMEAKARSGDFEWAIPVLFLRAFDGRVLTLRSTGRPAKTVSIFNVLDYGRERLKHTHYRVDLRQYFEGRFIRDPEEWNGPIMDRLRHTLHQELVAGNPIQLEIAAPLSIAFAAGFLLPAKERREIRLRQRDDVWSFDGDPPTSAASWLSSEEAGELVPADLPLSRESADCGDLAVVVEATRPALGAVADYLRRGKLDPPAVGHLELFRLDPVDQTSVKSGAHSAHLARQLVNRLDAVCRDLSFPRVHLFLAVPQALALALGRESHTIPRIQLYEFDFSKARHGCYEPSITLEPPQLGRTG